MSIVHYLKDSLPVGYQLLLLLFRSARYCSCLMVSLALDTHATSKRSDEKSADCFPAVAVTPQIKWWCSMTFLQWELQVFAG